MVDKPTTAEEFFTLFLLGLTWLREDRPEVLTRPGSSVFAALRHARVITEGQRRTLDRNARLVSYAMKESEVIKSRTKPTTALMRRRIAQSNKLVLTLVVPGGSLLYPKFFGTKGYQHAITEAGIVYAHDKAPLYRELIDPARFRAGWEKFRQQMIAYASRNPSQRHAVEHGTTDEEMGTIPTAKYTEEDFEW